MAPLVCQVELEQLAGREQLDKKEMWAQRESLVPLVLLDRLDDQEHLVVQEIGYELQQ